MVSDVCGFINKEHFLTTNLGKAHFHMYMENQQHIDLPKASPVLVMCHHIYNILFRNSKWMCPQADG